MSIQVGPMEFRGEVTQSGPVRNVAGQYKPAKVTFVIGAEAANVMNIAFTFRTENDVPVNVRTAALLYLSSDANGDTKEGSGPDSWAIGTDGIFFPDGSDSLISGVLVSEVTGKADLNLTHAGADTFYVNVIVDGRVFTSGAMTFDATT
jgi:hypothetical protein